MYITGTSTNWLLEYHFKKLPFLETYFDDSDHKSVVKTTLKLKRFSHSVTFATFYLKRC